MYLTKEQIEARILEALDDTIFYNGKRLDELLPVEERAQICVNIINNLPSTMPDIIDKYHKDRGTKEEIRLEDTYSHLLEEIIELGIELGIRYDGIYTKFLERLRIVTDKLVLLKKRNPETPFVSSKEKLLKELADITTIIGSISEYVNMRELLYDAILVIIESNDSKLCSLEEVKQTIKEQNLSNSSVRTKSLGNNKYIMIDDSMGKIIKPVGYKEPDLKHLFK